MSVVDLDEALADDEFEWSPRYRAALSVLKTLRWKSIPACADDPWYVDWDVLEAESGPWSNTERLRVRLARSLAEGDLCDAAVYLDDVNFAALLEALVVARLG
jgi:hypothetical protein